MDKEISYRVTIVSAPSKIYHRTSEIRYSFSKRVMIIKVWTLWTSTFLDGSEIDKKFFWFKNL